MNAVLFRKGLKKAVPVILSIISVIGVGATAVLSSKATAKALEIGEAAEKNGEDAVIEQWKCYIPAALAAIATAACIIGNGVLNRRRQASLLGAYALLERSYRQYRSKAKELFGEDANRRIMNEVAREHSGAQLAAVIHANPDTIYTPGFIGTYTTDWGTDEEEVQHLFFESFGRTYFTSTISKVLQAEIAANHNLALGGWVSMNDFYEFLGLGSVEGGDEIGWCVCDSYYTMEFDHYKAKLEDAPDGLEALVIDYAWIPMTEKELGL